MVCPVHLSACVSPCICVLGERESVEHPQHTHEMKQQTSDLTGPNSWNRGRKNQRAASPAKQWEIIDDIRTGRIARLRTMSTRRLEWTGNAAAAIDAAWVSDRRDYSRHFLLWLNFSVEPSAGGREEQSGSIFMHSCNEWLGFFSCR